MKTLGISITLAALASFAATAHAAPVPGAGTSCTTTREYITTLEYLRSRKDMAVPEADAQRTARKVSKGCTGAAGRFIRVTSLLHGTGLGPKDSLAKAIEFSGKTDRETETFVAVFKRAYFEDSLDLDLRSSIKMADALSAEFEGDTLAVRDDFEKLVAFCIQKDKLDLPRPQCGAYAARLAKRGQAWSGGIAVPFIRAFEFMRSDGAGPKLPTGKALELSEKLIGAGPDSPENFITGYKYAISKKGLSLGEQPALSFAMEMGLDTAEAAPVHPDSK